jgi:hypothetical protein
MPPFRGVGRPVRLLGGEAEVDVRLLAVVLLRHARFLPSMLTAAR